MNQLSTAQYQLIQELFAGCRQTLVEKARWEWRQTEALAQRLRQFEPCSLAVVRTVHLSFNALDIIGRVDVLTGTLLAAAAQGSMDSNGHLEPVDLKLMPEPVQEA